MIAVTAATGRLGRAVLAELAACVDANRLCAVARDPGRVEQAGIVCRAGDYNSEASMRQALEAVATLVLISAPVTPGIDRVQQHRTVIDAARLAGVQRVIFTSVIGNGQEVGTGFEATQAVNRRSEQDLKASGLDWTIARNALYLDLDLEHILRAADGDGVYRNNGGNGRCAYLSIAELAQGLARLALDDGHAGRCYNLSGETVSQAELVGLVNEVFGLAVRYVPISTEDNLQRLLAVPRIAARGEEVARMLSGCFECIANGAFDVPSDYESAAGRPPRSLREQLQALRSQLGR